LDRRGGELEMKRSVALAAATALSVAGLGTAEWAGASSTTPGTSTPTAGVRDGGRIFGPSARG
jgi:hypothetical protein